MARVRKPITYRKFYNMVNEKLKCDPDWDDSTLEYRSFLYSKYGNEPIGTHQFDVAAEVVYGGNEGIICRVNMYILMGDYSHKHITLATFKTLGEGRDDYMQMGRLAAVFSYNAMQVAEEHINDF